ncbi:MAG: ATP-binding protein [Bacteroidota bacterium]
MIVEFSVKNFRSIQHLQTLSFRATNLSSSPRYKFVDQNNIYEADANTKLLKTIGIYGANASGKSNIIIALEAFCEVISGLPSPQSRLAKLCQPFFFQENHENTASYFQIILMVEGRKYRYGFTVKKNMNELNDDNPSKEIISSEWLFGPKHINQVKLFTRKGLNIDNSNLPGKERIASLEYEHIPYLTHASSFSREISSKIWKAISGFMTTRLSQSLDYYRIHSIRQINNNTLKERFIAFFKSFGIEYVDIVFTDDNDYLKRSKFPLEKLFVTKKSHSGNGKNIVLNMKKHESAGTQKLFDLAGLIIHAFNIDRSGLIIIDEIDSNFHPSLLVKLVALFNDPEINKANTQLLFTSHDTNLMSPAIMRRDQFYFTEKDDSESTVLYSLAELKGIRNDADFAKHYLAGFYGSLPVLSDFINVENKQMNGALEYKI